MFIWDKIKNIKSKKKLFKDIMLIIESTPNDMDLGEKVRDFYKKKIKNDKKGYYNR